MTYGTKKLTAILLAALIASAALTGCTDTATNNKDIKPSRQPEPAIEDTTAYSDEIYSFGDFHLDGNGVLLGYTGNESELVLPKETTAVTDTSFDNCPNAQNITSIKMGSNVSKIHDSAFSKLSKLENIDVDEDNPYFISMDPDAFSSNGVISNDVFENILNNREKYSDIKRIFVKNAMLKVRLSKNALSITSIHALGQKKVFDTPMPTYGNFMLDFYSTPEVFILSKTAYGIGTKIIITHDGVEELNDDPYLSDMKNCCNYPVITFEKRDDGKLGYTKRPLKCIPLQDAAPLTYCASLDETAKEEGFVTFDSGKAEYHPEKTYNVSELFDMEEVFQSMYGERYNLNDFKTLDDMFKYNSEHYGIYIANK